ncbi:L,D-transpeptidase [Streptomyces sp. SL13]|uniref:L,D-transpeptidase n=1 Tax=Streptantibioticus silvisoli TaxID=2705255 RepID=A0AA90H991_9ACTN|nr:L,D-transpeptidase [Streptantibioticus silvisoli]MDI5965117.1 L,D-transpeptidase [Streptantibioticus silvisoli]MDI5972722.1 L,D-transpeptidase [Streptantibioticus silvisoli]
MAKVSSASIVTALTTAALAAVGVLAWQASAAPDHAGSAPRPSASASRHSAPPGPSAAQKKALALPAASGTGKRVVYSPGRHRVWLVAADGTVARTYAVAPGTVSPVAGTYKVTGHSALITGSDGVPVNHIVYFAVFQSVSIAFDAASDGSFPTPDPAKRTGAIREHVADAGAMWSFAPVGTKVVVVA